MTFIWDDIGDAAREESTECRSEVSLSAVVTILQARPFKEGRATSRAALPLAIFFLLFFSALNVG